MINLVLQSSCYINQFTNLFLHFFEIVEPDTQQWLLEKLSKVFHLADEQMKTALISFFNDCNELALPQELIQKI